jgi:lysylphosphatidylglycerol synthetase-like protein (DUF2156 family)
MNMLIRSLRKTALIVAVFAGLVGAMALVPSSAFAVTNTEAVCDAIGSGAACDKASGTDVNKVIRTVINVFSTVIGVVAVIMIMVAGFKYVTSSGDSSKTASAKNTLIYALIGLLIVVLAQTIVKTVLSKSATTPCPTGQTRNSRGVCV